MTIPIHVYSHSYKHRQATKSNTLPVVAGRDQTLAGIRWIWKIFARDCMYRKQLYILLFFIGYPVYMRQTIGHLTKRSEVNRNFINGVDRAVKISQFFGAMKNTAAKARCRAYILFVIYRYDRITNDSETEPVLIRLADSVRSTDCMYSLSTVVTID